MKETTSDRLKILPYLLGAAMFCIGAGRFLAQNDVTGAIIFGLSTLVAALVAAAKRPGHR